MSKQVFEYVVFYAPDKATADANTELKESEDSILLEGKILAESKESAKTTVIRRIDAKYEKVIDKLGVEIRAFRQGPGYVFPDSYSKPIIQHILR